MAESRRNWWKTALVAVIAIELLGGLSGFAVNLDDGRVQVVAEGPRRGCEGLLEWLRSDDTPGRVDGVTEIWDTPRGGYEGFAVR